ncbi:MAG: hypothetical protein IJ570_06985 [Prevotella sp.]|nr:hypothetical protein [Prevotella sp.]
MKKNLLKSALLAMLLMVSASSRAWTIDFLSLGAKYVDKTGVTISEAVASNVGTVSIVDGTLSSPEEDGPTTGSDVLPTNFALQTGSSWLVRPGGLYSANGGGRNLGILNCKKDQNITMAITIAPTPTSGNVELKSEENGVYVYTVTEDGNVIFSITRYSYITEISVNWEIDFLTLGAQFVDKTGVTISDAVYSNVGTVSIVNGTLQEPIDEETTTASVSLDPSFTLQTGSSWLVRPGGLYSANGGGRNLGVLNCKKDQNITMAITIAPNPTSGNVELKSDEDGVYVYTVTEDGNVIFSITRYSYLTKIGVSDVAGVEYTVKFVNEVGEKVKEDAIHKGEPGSVVELTAGDIAPIRPEDGGKLLFKEADNDENNLIKEDGSTVVTVVFRNAEKYFAVLNCMIENKKGADNRLAQYNDTTKYWFWEGDNLTLYPARGYKHTDGAYYFTPASNTYNGVTFTFPGSVSPVKNGGKTYYIGTQNYNVVDSVAYYSEVENMTLEGEVKTWVGWTELNYGPGNYFDRFSQGSGPRLTDGSYFYTDPIAESATYKVSIYLRNGGSGSDTESAAYGLRDAEGEVSIFSIDVQNWGSAGMGYENVEVGIPAGSSFVIMNDGNAGDIDFDCVSMTKIGDYVATPSVETGIQTVRTHAANSTVYNLNGQVVKNAQKGLYIKNGKKYIVK